MQITVTGSIIDSAAHSLAALSHSLGREQDAQGTRRKQVII